MEIVAVLLNLLLDSAIAVVSPSLFLTSLHGNCVSVLVLLDFRKEKPRKRRSSPGQPGTKMYTLTILPISI
jgi:hypothetical protein